MTRIRRVISSVRHALTGKNEVRRISDLVIHGNGWYISGGEYCEVER